MTLVSEIFAKSFGVELITSFVSAKRSRRGRKKFFKKIKKEEKKNRNVIIDSILYW